MKKVLCVLTAVLVVLLAFCSCGSSYASKESYNDTAEYAIEPADSEFDYGYNGNSDEGFLSEDSAESKAVSSQSGKADYQAIADASSRKLIRDASLNIETETYDDFMKKLESEIGKCGGYVENSSESGGVYSYQSYRSSSLTVRIPSEKLDSFLGSISEIAVVTSKSISVKDITGSYIDTQSRIKALETERDALLAILAKADNVIDLITVQDRLTEVNAELESCKSKLKTYDELISYSTVRMEISEVKRATGTEELSFGKEILRKLSDNLYNIGQGLRNFAINFISSIPYLLIIAVIIAVAVIIIKKAVGRAKKRRTAKRAEQAKPDTPEDK